MVGGVHGGASEKSNSAAGIGPRSLVSSSLSNKSSVQLLQASFRLLYNPSTLLSSNCLDFQHLFVHLHLRTPIVRPSMLRGRLLEELTYMFSCHSNLDSKALDPFSWRTVGSVQPLRQDDGQVRQVSGGDSAGGSTAHPLSNKDSSSPTMMPMS